MLTKVTAYNTLSNLDPLVWNIINRPDSDLFEVRDIVGLGPVKADVNTTPMGSVDKEAYVGGNVGKRNLVFTIGLDPNWEEWNVSKLRNLLSLYFMPKFQVRFVFESTEFSPVEIFGIVESNEPNIFSKDPEHQISIICPDPDFTSVNALGVTRTTDDGPVDIVYNGNLETGITLIVDNSADPDPLEIMVQNTNFDVQTFAISASTPIPFDATHSFLLNTIPGKKFVIISADSMGAGEVNLLRSVMDGSDWIKLKPGTNQFEVSLDTGTKDWHLQYYEHFGSL